MKEQVCIALIPADDKREDRILIQWLLDKFNIAADKLFLRNISFTDISGGTQEIRDIGQDGHVIFGLKGSHTFKRRFYTFALYGKFVFNCPKCQIVGTQQIAAPYMKVSAYQDYGKDTHNGYDHGGIHKEQSSG